MSSSSNGYFIPQNSSKRLAQSLALYRPFAGGILVVIISTYIICQILALHMIINSYQIMNAFMACFFIIFAVPKFFDLPAFITTFKQYDIVSKYVPMYAQVFPFIELCIGLSLLANMVVTYMVIGQVLNLAIVAFSSLGIVSVGQSLRQKKSLSCACMGAHFAFPLSKISLVENGSMLVMSLAMLLLMKPDHMVMAVSHWVQLA